MELKAINARSIQQILIALLCAVSLLSLNSFELVSNPPELNNKAWHKYISFRSEQAFTLARYTVRFKINQDGNLDTLIFSSNAPERYKDSIRLQLRRLDGSWVIKSENLKKRWLIFNFYDFGIIDYTGKSGKIPTNVHTEYEALNRQLRKEEALFVPTQSVHSETANKLTPLRYISTEEGWLFRPIVSRTSA